MKLQVIVAPDFGQERGIDWILLSALLRRRGIEMDVRVPATLAEYDSAIALGSADLVLANPVDAIELVRRGGYLPVARPTLKQDEMYVACAAESRARTIRDLRPGCRIALTADRCVEIVGLRLLEPANLDNSNSTRIGTNDYWVMKTFCVDGLGIALLPDFFAGPEVKHGSLVPVLPDWKPERRRIFCAYQRQRYAAKKLQAFISLLTESMADIDSFNTYVASSVR